MSYSISECITVTSYRDYPDLFQMRLSAVVRSALSRSKQLRRDSNSEMYPMECNLIDTSQTVVTSLHDIPQSLKQIRLVQVRFSQRRHNFFFPFYPMFAIHSSDGTEESKWAGIVTPHYADTLGCIYIPAALNAEKSLLPFPLAVCMIEMSGTARGARTRRRFDIFYMHAGNIWADIRISSHYFRLCESPCFLVPLPLFSCSLSFSLCRDVVLGGLT